MKFALNQEKTLVHLESLRVDASLTRCLRIRRLGGLLQLSGRHLLLLAPLRRRHLVEWRVGHLILLGCLTVCILLGGGLVLRGLSCWRMRRLL